ncbi:ribokinase [Bosea sp. (in: a-proteobacteria)]|uniref:ribokinase n=1 Tax=Bosea sp. (in: a-proteobacteria) TaxID=1871050 RepID=UPI0025C2F6A3|nr:ribokinase [Bosea sp. (in: a-proteobacteria)]
MAQSSDTILVFGSLNVDLVTQVRSIARPGETVLAASYETLCGGKGANQAVAAARVSAPGRVAMAGRVGADGFGRICLDNLAANGVHIGHVMQAAEPTGCAFISVDARGENAITVASGANAAVSAADAPLAPTGATLILQMEVPLAASLAAARQIREAGGRVVWNLAPVPHELDREALRLLLAAADILVVNEHEAVAAATCLGNPEAGLEAAGSLLATTGHVTCVVTAGAKGAIAFHPDGSRIDAAAAAIEPVDTTGAGDTFVGILAASLADGMDWPAALARACKGASLACLAHGAQTSMPTADALLQRG